MLIDSAAALLATSKAMREPRELRETAEEMRKRLIKVTRACQTAFDTRQEKARADLTEQFGDRGGAVVTLEGDGQTH